MNTKSNVKKQTKKDFTTTENFRFDHHVAEAQDTVVHP
jgi:hypothetical protein